MRARAARWALLLAAATALLVPVPVAAAATGGASSFEASAPTAASDGELAFGPTRYAGASWYGPGLWGRSTACGQVLRPATIGVAHRSLPCGTLVRFTFHRRSVTAPVIDRGPYIRGRAWDLTAAAASAIGLTASGVGRVAYRVAVDYARH